VKYHDPRTTGVKVPRAHNDPAKPAEEAPIRPNPRHDGPGLPVRREVGGGVGTSEGAPPANESVHLDPTPRHKGPRRETPQHTQGTPIDTPIDSAEEVAHGAGPQSTAPQGLQEDLGEYHQGGERPPTSRE